MDDRVPEGGVNINLNGKYGIRQSSSQSYQHPLWKAARNLTVLTNTRANSILLNETNTAYGVETDTATILATREIVLSSGTFETPKLLLLSVIPPRHHLHYPRTPPRTTPPPLPSHSPTTP